MTPNVVTSMADENKIDNFEEEEGIEMVMPIATEDFVIPGKGQKRPGQLKQFADFLLKINELIDFELSSRGWCYQLEGFNVIDKGQFNLVQKILNECRKKGYLPIDFVAEDSARELEGSFKVTEVSREQFLHKQIQWVLESYRMYNADYWRAFEYYVVMLVEKVDLIGLFYPVCKEYKIKIGNSKGWSSILQRAEIAEEFKFHEEEYNQTPVLLYCGDLDPFGFAISDRIKKNFKDIELGTGWDPKLLVVDRFGLNRNTVDELGLTWIDNLKSGSGKAPDLSNPIVQKYIAEYGERKVEANAIVIRPDKARQLCRDAIEKYLGTNALQIIEDRYKADYTHFWSLLKELDLEQPMRDSKAKIKAKMAEELIEWVEDPMDDEHENI